MQSTAISNSQMRKHSFPTFWIFVKTVTVNNYEDCIEHGRACVLMSLNNLSIS